MDTKQIVKNILLFFAFVFFVGTIIGGLQWFSKSIGGFFEKKVALTTQSFLASLESSLANQQQIPSNLLPTRNWEVAELNIDAESAISIETDLKSETKVLFKKDEEKVLPIASLTKLMTALVTLENYSLDQKVTISKEAVAQEGEQGSLKEGQILSIKDLLYIMLIESSNDAAYAIADVVGQNNFVFLMNEKAKSIGLLKTKFIDASGLNPKDTSTAKDLVVLTEQLLNNYPLVFEIIGSKEFDLILEDGTIHHKLINTNKLLGEIPEIIGGKTGYTKDAKGCFLVIAKSKKEGSYMIHVVLGAPDRLEEIKKIINWINSAYKW